MKCQIVFWGKNKKKNYMVTNPVFWEKEENITNLSSAELVQRVVKVK